VRQQIDTDKLQILAGDLKFPPGKCPKLRREHNKNWLTYLLRHLSSATTGRHHRRKGSESGRPLGALSLAIVQWREKGEGKVRVLEAVGVAEVR
jgi:hypothetical protein